jgi:protein O-mannosyl-transferase
MYIPLIEKWLTIQDHDRAVVRFVKRHWVILCCLFVTALVYLPSLFTPFYFDDYDHILENPRIKDFSYFPELLRTFYFVRGWVQMSLAVDWWLYDGQIYGMHITNVLFHLLNTLLVYLVASRLFRVFQDQSAYTVSPRIEIPVGALSAFLFAVHPMQTETVTYIISRSELICAAAYLTGFWLIMRIADILVDLNTRMWKRICSLVGINILVGLSVVAGIGAKEMILTIPAAVVLYLFLLYRKKNAPGFYRDITLLGLPFVILLSLYLQARIQSTGSILAGNDFTARTPYSNILSQISLIVFYYFPRIFIPVNLNIDPQIPQINSAMNGWFLAAFVIIGLLIAVSFAAFRRKPLITFGILWFFITISVTSSFIPLLDLAAERRVYLPLSGSIVLFELMLVSAAKKVQWVSLRRGVLAIVLLAFPLITLLKNVEYTDPVKLWRTSAILSPQKFRPMRNMGGALMQDNRHDEALLLFTDTFQGVKADGRSFKTIQDIDFAVSLLIPKGMYITKGTQMAEQLAQEMPNSVPHLELLAKVYLLTGEYAKLKEVVNRGLQLNGRSLTCLLYKAIEESQSGQIEQAIATLQRGIQFHPYEIEFYERLYYLYRAQGKNTAELEQKIKALKGQLKNYSSRFNIQIGQ